MNAHTTFAWIETLPIGTLVVLSQDDDGTESVGLRDRRFIYTLHRIEPRGEVRIWAIDNDIPCLESPGGGGYALMPATPNDALHIRMRWH